MKSRKRALRKFRKKSIVAPILLFFFGTFFICFFALFVFWLDVESIREMNMRYQSDVACVRAQMIIDSLEQYDNDIGKAIEASKQDVVIVKNKKQVYSNTDVVLDSESVSCEILDDYYVYLSDEDMNELYVRFDGNIKPNSKTGNLTLGSMTVFSEFWFSNDNIVDNRIVFFNAWYPTDVEYDGGHLLIHAPVSIEINELITGVAILICFIFLVLVIAAVLFINIIVSAIRNNRMLHALYFDDKTLEHNWLFLTTKAEKMLSKNNGTYGFMSIKCCKYDHVKSCSGAAAADALLLNTFQIMKTFVRSGDLIARFSDDSIGIVIRRGTIQEIGVVANNLVNKFRDQIYVGCNIVIKDKRNAKTIGSVEDYYHYAELACNSLDESSPYRVAYFDEALREKYIWEAQVESKLDEALAKEEFEIYVQPKYDPRDSRLKGAEALIKWNSPEFGLVQPGRFIPICEEDGNIVKIDDYMISHIARLQSDWLRRGFAIVPISVNVSRAHFMDVNLAEHICSLVDAYGTPHQYIEIELTESAFFDDKRVMLSTVGKLQSMGFLVSMDDFGSGYSSLNSLKDLSLDILKLDAGFFRGEGMDSRGELIVSKAIELAKALNMEIVAEGVEKKEQVEFLANAGCDLIQGYYFDKPITTQEYETRMTRLITEEKMIASTQPVLPSQDAVQQSSVQQTAQEPVQQDEQVQVQAAQSLEIPSAPEAPADEPGAPGQF